MTTEYVFKAPTIKDVLKLNTKQKIYDHVARHLLLQGEGSGKLQPTRNDSECGFKCFYRSTGTRNQVVACAAGALLPESQVRFIDNSGAWEPQEGMSPIFTAWVLRHGSVVCLLQDIHDTITEKVGRGRTKKPWSTEISILLRKIAGRERLSTAVLDEFS